MNSEEGQTFVKSLAQFVRTHEKVLANALHVRPQDSKSGYILPSSTEASSKHGSSTQNIVSASSTSSALAAALSLGTLRLTSQNIKPTKLTLTPHHLFYLLARFEELGVSVGPMNVRTESLQAEASPANYVSFLSQSHRSKDRSDRDSIHSVSSIRSAMSSVSALWFGLGASNSAAKTEKAQAQQIIDLKYLFSAFTKLPCLHLSPDRRAPLIRGYEEFPFDTAVPLLSFKNLSVLEVSDVDFRQFYGWDKLAEQLRSLTLKRANVDDPTEILIKIVLDDMDKRRRRSSKAQSSPVLAWPLAPPMRLIDSAKTISPPNSPGGDDQLGQSVSPRNGLLRDARNSSTSPSRPTSSKQETPYRHMRTNSTKVKRSGSGSSTSSVHSIGPSTAPCRAGSTSNLLLTGAISPLKWRFLKHLSLTDNSLTSIPLSSLAPLANTLHSLDLSSNLFTEMPDGLANLVALRALNLSNCMIDGLQSLIRHPLPAITALNLRANRLLSLAGIERLLSLERLDLRENKITDPIEFARLTSLPEFREIWVIRNPFTKTYSNYRIVIFNLFRGTPGSMDDIMIEGSGPGYSERRQLVDRTADVEPVSVVRCSSPDIQPPRILENNIEHTRALQETHETNLPQQEPPSMTSYHAEDFTPGTSSHVTQYALSKGSFVRPTRSKRGNRRQRIVDLSSDEGLTSKSDNTQKQSYQTAIEETAKSHNDIEVDHTFPRSLLRRKLPFSGPLDHMSQEPCHNKLEEILPPSVPSDMASGDKGLLIKDVHTSKPTADAYRQRLESLKTEIGNNWLCVLGEEGWSSKKVDPKSGDLSGNPSSAHGIGPGVIAAELDMG